ncbi:MAG: xylulokinase [Anaerolineae bacterium]|nr:xylulokinase [Anaerolineae bacterium]
MKNYILAHDLGTTGNKATLYNGDGQLVGAASYAYNTDYPHTGWAEQDPEDWWQAICSTTHEVLRKTNVSPNEIAGVAFSGQMQGCVPVDSDARPLRKAMIWADQRALAQEHWIGEHISAEEMYRISGHRLSASYSLPKILWLREHQPDVYQNTYKFMQAKDAIIARLTGVFATDPSDASGTNLYDLEACRWSEKILEITQLDLVKLPEIRLSTDVVGAVLPEVADEVGLVAGTPVVIGGGDGACAAAGAGVVHEGSAYNYIGSSSWIALTSRKPIYDPEFRTFTFAHVVPGMVMPTGTMQSAGAAYQWTRDQLAGVQVRAAEALGISTYELMNLEAETAPPGSNGLIFLPYLMGERSPRWNPLARGAFIGITIRQTRADLIRAVLEGITMNLRIILKAFTDQGAQIDAMRLIGGGAQGRFWNQMMADIYGIPAQRLAILEEATSMGAALTGGVGVGLYPDFSMAETMNRVVQTFQPDPVSQAAYEPMYPIFEAAYQAMIPIYEMMANRSE